MYLYFIFSWNELFERIEIVACSTDYYYIRRLRKKYQSALYRYKRISIDYLFNSSVPFSW